MLWARLTHAARARHDPWRWPVLATVALDGAPSARVVVLRTVEPADGLIRVHSDSRAAKVAEIAAEPRVALTFLDAGHAGRPALQLRLTGMAACERAPAQLEAAWARVPEESRRNYSGGLPPGTPLPDGACAAVVPSGDSRHFAMLRVQVRRLEWLWLGEQHRRGLFRAEDNWRAIELVP